MSLAEWIKYESEKSNFSVVVTLQKMYPLFQKRFVGPGAPPDVVISRFGHYDGVKVWRSSWCGLVATCISTVFPQRKHHNCARCSQETKGGVHLNIKAETEHRLSIVIQLQDSLDWLQIIEIVNYLNVHSVRPSLSWLKLEAYFCQSKIEDLQCVTVRVINSQNIIPNIKPNPQDNYTFPNNPCPNK